MQIPLVCDILPSTTAVFSYAIGPRKLSANDQFFVGAQTVVSCHKQLDYIRRLFYVAMLFTPAQIKLKSFELRRNVFFKSGVDASHGYVRAWVLGCFHSLISTQTPSTGL